MRDQISWASYIPRAECSQKTASLRRSAAPVVSVIIPTHNDMRNILCAVDSVIAQTFTDFEIIIVNDCSSDRTLDLLAELDDSRIHFVTHRSNKGAAASRNSGIRLARGRYIAFLDSDDLWATDKLERQLAYMAARRGKIRLSCTAFHYYDETSGLRETRMLQPMLSRETLLRGCRCSPGSTLLAERSLFQEIGLMNENMRRLEDWDWLLRCSLLSPLGILQQPLATVQARLSSDGHYMQVIQSAPQIRRSLDHVARNIGKRKARLIASTSLANELAAAAYRDGNWFRAVGHFVEAVPLTPAHQFLFAARARARLWNEAKRIMASWMGTVQRASHRSGPTQATQMPLEDSRP